MNSKIIKINNNTYVLQNDCWTVLDLLNKLGIKVPSFCYHPSLSLEGNCRMCLIELENMQKPQASCCLPLTHGQKIYTDTPFIKKARENILQSLLVNHPLDCPICDQGGECDLQDQSFKYGIPVNSNIFFFKRALPNKIYNLFIKLILNRCIHCTRCIRFCEEFLNNSILGSYNRGKYTEIGLYIKSNFNFEFTNNLITICPVGALTAKPYSFTIRPWELQSISSIDFNDSFCMPIKLEYKGFKLKRITPIYQQLQFNNSWLNDRIIFCIDAITTHRLELPSYLEKTKKFNSTYPIFLVILFLRNILKNFKNQLVFNIPLSLDLYSLFLLQYNYNKFNINFDQFNKYNNFKSLNFFSFQYLYSNKISKNILLIGLNTRLESSYLNLFFIKNKQINPINIYLFGSAYQLLIEYKHLGFKIKKIQEYFYSQNFFCKSFLHLLKNTKFIYNSNLFSRFDSKILYNLFQYLSIKLYKSSLNTVTSTCNSTGINCFNILKTYPKNYQNKILFSYNETININSIYNIFLNSYNSTLNSVNLILPIRLPFEHSGQYIDNIGFSHKTFPLPQNTNIPTTSKILKKLFYNKIQYNKINYKFFLILTKSTFPQNFKLHYFHKILKFNYFKFYFLLQEPFSNYLENFYQNNTILKHSFLLQTYSRHWISDLQNFK